MNCRLVLLSCLSCFLIAANLAPVDPAAQALATGLNAYSARHYDRAKTALRPLADRGSAIAETLLGVMAARGEGDAADPAVAVGWWMRAAERGYPPAQLALAKALANGHGVDRDPGHAWVWARLASRGGGGGVSRDAAALAAQLGRGLSPAERAARAAECAAWRPRG